MRVPQFGATTSMSLPQVLTFSGARKWYLGSSVALLWLAFIAYDFLRSSSELPAQIEGMAFIVVFGAAFAISVPFSWWLRPAHRFWVIIGLWALSFTLFPIIGFEVCRLWTYVGVLVGMSMLSMRTSTLWIAGVTGMCFLFLFLGGARGEALVAFPAVTASVSMMMAGLARQILAINQLRATQHELAVLAVEKERGRVARDIHDILGHSLTAITVRSELAGMLIDVDQRRAATEIAAVESLARDALADVRSTVAGYRGVTIVGELATARSLLESAGIRCELPSTTDAVPSEHRELAGWVVREGVTNVVRHSGATVCRVTLSTDGVEIADDGRGPAGGREEVAQGTHGDDEAPGDGGEARSGAMSGGNRPGADRSDPRGSSGGQGGAGGTGLRGLGERVAAAGGTMTVGRSDLGGFLLRVTFGGAR